MTGTDLALSLIALGAVCVAAAGWWRAWYWKRTAERYQHGVLWEIWRGRVDNRVVRPRHEIEDES